jgi:hypothetical protein
LRLFREKIAAGDLTYRAVEQVLLAADVKVVPNPYGLACGGLRKTMAPDAVRQLILNYGTVGAREVLAAVADAKMGPITRAQLLAAAILMHGETKMSAVELTATMASRPIKATMATAKRLAVRDGVRPYVALAWFWKRNRAGEQARAA